METCRGYELSAATTQFFTERELEMDSTATMMAHKAERNEPRA